jgi:sugar phosphate permease
MTVDAQSAKNFHGWWVVLAGFVCTVMAIGSTTYCFGLFVAPLAQEFELSRADANGGFIFLLLGFALWAPLVGRLLDRAPARLVMVAGGWLFALGFGLIAFARSPLLMGLAILGPVSLGTVAAGALAANTVAARWFHRHRGRALGVLAVSTSVGGFTMPPLVAQLMGSYGWRYALGVQGLVVAGVVTLAVLLLIRDRPSDLGLNRDGADADPAQPAAASAPAGAEWPFRKLLRTPNFWLVACGAGILLGADQALLTSMIPYGTDAGLSLTQASLLMSCLTFSAIIGKLGIGALADRVDKRMLFCAVAACNFTFLGVLLLGPSYPVLLLACCIIGLAIGGTYPLWMTITADCFGTASFGAVMGTMNLVTMPFAIGAVRYIGAVFDRSKSYDTAFITFMFTAGIATALILMVRVPRTS